MLPVPEPVRSKAIAAGQQDWLNGLPELVAGLAADWSLQIGTAYADATEGLVLRVTCADATPAVLKVQIPGRETTQREIAVLELAGGVGCARLLACDVDRDALLLERLGGSLHDLGMPFAQRLPILCAAAARVWRPVPIGLLPSGADQARWLIEWMSTAWDDAGRPCSAEAVEHALSCAQRREAAHDDDRAVLVHGDVHEWNTLAAPDGGFKLVDPDGLRAEPECDLGVIMREDPLELLDGDPWQRAHWLAHQTGLDAVAVWEWGVAERVSTGLLAHSIGLQPIGADMLRAADRIAAEVRGEDGQWRG